MRQKQASVGRVSQRRGRRGQLWHKYTVKKQSLSTNKPNRHVKFHGMKNETGRINPPSFLPLFLSPPLFFPTPHPSSVLARIFQHHSAQAGQEREATERGQDRYVQGPHQRWPRNPRDENQTRKRKKKRWGFQRRPEKLNISQVCTREQIR